MDIVFEGVRASDENVIGMDINEIEATSNFVHKTLEGLDCVAKTNGHLGKLKKQTKGVLIAVLQMSSSAIGIW
jgi:hypothetical protein